MNTNKRPPALLALGVAAVLLTACGSNTGTHTGSQSPSMSGPGNSAKSPQAASYQFPANGAPETTPGQSLVVSLPADLLTAAGPADVAQLRVKSFTLKPYPLATNTSCAVMITPQLTPGGAASILAAENVAAASVVNGMSDAQKIGYALLGATSAPLSTLSATNPVNGAYITPNGHSFVVVDNCSMSPTDTSSLNTLNFMTVPTGAEPTTTDSFADVQIAMMSKGILAVPTNTINGWQRDANGNWITTVRQF